MKTKGALGVGILEFVLVGFHHGAWVEGAVICGCAKPHQHFSVEAEGRELVADALFSSWSRSPDGLSQPLERGPLVVAQGRKVIVNGLGLSLDLGLSSHGFFS